MARVETAVEEYLRSPNWDQLVRAFPTLAALAECPQDARHHAEGDVATHTQMVLSSLLQDSVYAGLTEIDRQDMFLAALFHDLGKPQTTRQEMDGSLSSKGHSRRGEIMVRQLLWREGYDFKRREKICQLIRLHQLPLAVATAYDLQRRLLAASCRVSLEQLTLLSRADAQGRLCKDQSSLLTSVEMFADYCRELNCYQAPYPFDSEVARFEYLHSSSASQPWAAFDDTRSRVLVTSGLPGTGKDTYLARSHPGLPVISLDELRRELRLDPGDHQAAVVGAAHQRAKEFLRSGQDFAWNATNISRQLREQLVSFLHAYKARVQIAYLEVPEAVLLEQNRSRAAAVPEAVMSRLLERWEVPTLDEVHGLECLVHEAPGVEL